MRDRNQGLLCRLVAPLDADWLRRFRLNQEAGDALAVARRPVVDEAELFALDDHAARDCFLAVRVIRTTQFYAYSVWRRDDEHVLPLGGRTRLVPIVGYRGCSVLGRCGSLLRLRCGAR